MGYAAKWKALEDLMIALNMKGFATSPKIIGDLRSAKLMIKISGAGEGSDDASMKLDEILGTVESELVSGAQNVLTSEEIDEWLKRLDGASLPTCEVKGESEAAFVTGVPRDQKWIRVEPIARLSTLKLQQIAKENSLSLNQQKDGRLSSLRSTGRHKGVSEENDRRSSNEKISAS